MGYLPGNERGAQSDDKWIYLSMSRSRGEREMLLTRLVVSIDDLSSMRSKDLK